MADSVLVELIRGKGAFTDALACVSGLDAASAGQRGGAPYSVYELVFHMNYWMDYERRRIDGASPAYPEHAAESWPAKPEPQDEATWQGATTTFAALLEQMIALARDEAGGARLVPATSTASYANQGASLRDVLWQTLVHNAYHLGQVATVRRVLGVWPPAGGGDTW